MGTAARRKLFLRPRVSDTPPPSRLPSAAPARVLLTTWGGEAQGVRGEGQGSRTRYDHLGGRGTGGEGSGVRGQGSGVRGHTPARVLLQHTCMCVCVCVCVHVCACVHAKGHVTHGWTC